MLAKPGRPRQYRIRDVSNNGPLIHSCPAVWNHYLYEDITSATQRIRLQAMKSFTAWINQKTNKSLTEFDTVYLMISQGLKNSNLLLKDFSNYLEDKKKYAPTTINTNITALRSLYKSAQTVGAINYTVNIKKKRTKPFGLTQGPTLEQVKAAFNEIDLTIQGKNPNPSQSSVSRRRCAIRLKALMTLCYPLALRPIEIARLERSDLDLDRRSLKILGKYRDESEIINFSKFVEDALKAWLELRGNSAGPLFVRVEKNINRRTLKLDKMTALSKTEISNLFTTLGKQLGFELNCRGLRHAAITNVIIEAQKKGYPIEECLKFSRHSSLNTLIMYRDHITNRQSEFTEILSSEFI